MSANILEHDRGAVWGETWHGIPSYIQQNQPVSALQALEILGYPIEKRQLECPMPEGHVPVNNWAIVRTDHDIVVASGVGSIYSIERNSEMFAYIHEHVMAEYPQLKIESVGTLGNGATAFVNLKSDEFQIRGDQSSTLSRIMWYNPIGRGSYRLCAHTIRVVCQNTLNAAESEGRRNKSLQKVRHTKSAKEKMNRAVDEVAAAFLRLMKQKEDLEVLARIEMDGDEATTWLERFIGYPAEATELQRLTIDRKRQRIAQQLEQDESLGDLRQTRYGLLQAIMYDLDHDTPRGKWDATAVGWDGLTGRRAVVKQRALSSLIS